MESKQQLIQTQLDELREIVSSEFSAFSETDGKQSHFRWDYVSGNISERYRVMSPRTGHGIVGMVTRVGRPVIIDANNPEVERIRLTVPLMIAERLYSAIAAPVIMDDQIIGVILIGDRCSKTYDEQTKELLQRAAERLAKSIYEKRKTGSP